MSYCVLGLQYHDADYFHDSSAALWHDNKLSMCEEERFNKVKHSPKTFPYNSIKNLLTNAHIDIDNIDCIVLPLKVSENNVMLNIKQFFGIGKQFCFLHCNHHLSHFLNAYKLSGFDNAVGIVIDADGDDYVSTSIFDANKNDIRCIKTFSTEQSLGMLYQAASEYCNFGIFGEGKLMGLASFGNSLKNHYLRWNDETDDIDVLMQSGCSYKHSIIMNSQIQHRTILCKYLYEKPMSNITQFLRTTFYPYKRCTYEDEIIYYKDLAATIQENYCTILMKLAQFAKRMTNKNNLILSGGCIQNCVGNELIAQSKLFEHIFSSSIPHDGGISLGNAIYGALTYSKEQNFDEIHYSRCCYSLKSISADLNSKVKISEINISEIADDILSGKILGWFQGGAELGPRALGHRSIIANPSIRENLNVINRDIKHRDMFRPLAPIILDVLFSNVFGVDNIDLCQYMLRTLKIHKNFQEKLIAVCHIDGTTRPQVLSEQENPELYSVIECIYNKSGIPGIISTSFNDKGVPIVESLDDAIRMLLRSNKLSYVVFDGKFKIDRIS